MQQVLPSLVIIQMYNKIQILQNSLPKKRKMGLDFSFYQFGCTISGCGKVKLCKLLLRAFCHLNRTTLSYKTLRLLEESEVGLL